VDAQESPASATTKPRNIPPMPPKILWPQHVTTKTLRTDIPKILCHQDIKMVKAMDGESGSNSAEEQQDRQDLKPCAPYFAGVFLAASSQHRLLTHIPPKHSEISARHITLAFQPDISTCLELPLGREVAVAVLGVAHNKRAQALAVSLPSWVPCFPETTPFHVTVSVAPGVSPKEAGELTQNAQRHRSREEGAIAEPVAAVRVLHGVIGVCMTDESIIYCKQELIDVLSAEDKARVASIIGKEQRDLPQPRPRKVQTPSFKTLKNREFLGVASAAARNGFSPGDNMCGWQHAPVAKCHKRASGAARRQASAAAFRLHNAQILNTFKLDLHGMYVEESIAALDKYLCLLSLLQHPGGVLLQVVTGMGKNSPGGRARVLPAVVEHLAEGGYLFDLEEINPGMVRVLLESATTAAE